MRQATSFLLHFSYPISLISLFLFLHSETVSSLIVNLPIPLATPDSKQLYSYLPFPSCLRIMSSKGLLVGLPAPLAALS